METGISVTAKDVLFIIEGAEGEKRHRVDVIYLCDYDGESDVKYHPDKIESFRQHTTCFLTILDI